MPKKHICKASDHISIVAVMHGFRDWNTIWDANKDRLKRDCPTTLYKGRTRTGNGDYLDIPDPSEAPVAKGVDAHHPFKVGVDKLMIRVRIFRDDMTPLKKAPYELTIPGKAEPLKGTTTDAGLIEHEVPANSQRATLSVRMKAADSDATTPATTPAATPSTTPTTTTTPTTAPTTTAPAPPPPLRGDVPVTWTLEIGALNPIKEVAPDEFCISGFQQRLNNICLNTGPVDGILGPNTRAAIKAFQDMYQIKGEGVEAGVPDVQKTQKTMYDLHDGPTPPALPSPSGA